MLVPEYQSVSGIRIAQRFCFSSSYKMRDIISGRVFEHKKRMKDDFIQSRIVRGGSGKVEQTMRSAG